MQRTLAVAMLSLVLFSASGARPSIAVVPAIPNDNRTPAGALANDTLTVRSVFIVGPDKKVKLILTYPASTGRNVDEILRVLDSLQLTADYKVATPVNWTDGEDVIVVPALSDEEAKERFPKGFKALKPYLRVTPQPNK